MITKSKCCNAEVKVGGEGITHYYVCIKCDKPCDAMPEDNVTTNVYACCEICGEVVAEAGRKEVRLCKCLRTCKEE